MQIFIERDLVLPNGNRTKIGASQSCKLRSPANRHRILAFEILALLGFEHQPLVLNYL